MVVVPIHSYTYVFLAISCFCLFLVIFHASIWENLYCVRGAHCEGDFQGITTWLWWLSHYHQESRPHTSRDDLWCFFPTFLPPHSLSVLPALEPSCANLMIHDDMWVNLLRFPKLNMHGANYYNCYVDSIPTYMSSQTINRDVLLMHTTPYTSISLTFRNVPDVIKMLNFRVGFS